MIPFLMILFTRLFSFLFVEEMASTSWNLWLELSNNVMTASISLAIPLCLPTCTILISLISWMKLEASVESITILNDNIDISSPLQAMPAITSSQESPLLDSPNESLVYSSRAFCHWDLKQTNSIV